MTCKLLICFLRLHDMFSCIVDKPKRNSKVSCTQCFPSNIWKYENKIMLSLKYLMYQILEEKPWVEA